MYGIRRQIHTCTHTYKHIHMCLPHPPYTHTQLQGRWPGLGSAGRAGPGPSVCSGWSPAGVGISGPRRVCRAGVHKCTSSPGLHFTDCGFLDGPGPWSSVPTCREDGMLSSEPTGLLVLRVLTSSQINSPVSCFSKGERIHLTQKRSDLEVLTEGSRS